MFDLLTGCLLASVICILAFFKKWLSMGGAIAAMLLGTLVWTIGHWQAAIPLLLFFSSSSLLSYAGNGASVIDKKDKQPRDAVQVLCNGGVAAACLFLFFLLENEYWYLGYWVSLSISTSDTWSSALGSRFAQKVYDIKNGKQIMKGLSGGVSIIGSMAGLVGAACIAFCGLLIAGYSFPWFIVTIAGFAGMLLDSLLGSLFQARYRLPSGNLVEYHPGGELIVLEKGLSWMTNDIVNIVSNFMLTSLFILLHSFYIAIK